MISFTPKSPKGDPLPLLRYSFTLSDTYAPGVSAFGGRSLAMVDEVRKAASALAKRGVAKINSIVL